jgi:hypothetical protein
MGKVVAILATLLAIVAIVHADAMINEISLKGYSKLGDGVAVIGWFTGESVNFYIKYRLINTPNGKLAIREELTGKNIKGTLEDIHVIGTYTIASKDKSKTKQFRFIDDFNNDKKVSEYRETLPRETLLDPANGYYDREKDTITIFSLIDYKINDNVSGNGTHYQKVEVEVK